MRDHRVPGRVGERAVRRAVPPGRARPADPAEPLSAASVLALQRTVGNAAVARSLAGRDVDVQRRAVGVRPEVDVQRRAVDDVLRSAGRPLDDGVKADMESRLGADFSAVRVHTDAKAHAAAESVRAKAFTSGSHVVFAQRQFDPASTAGRRMLAHELVHVVQQWSGPVAGRDRGDGLRVSDPADEFERQAESTAAEAVSGHAHDLAPAARGAVATAHVPVQRVSDDEEEEEEDDGLPVMATDEFEFTTSHSSRYGRRVRDGWRVVQEEPDPIPALTPSRDRTVAIRRDVAQPKEFFATKAVVTKANQDLARVGAHVELAEGSFDVPPPPGGREKLVVVRPKLQLPPSEPGKYADLVKDQCVEVAEQILRPLTHLVFRGPTGAASTADLDLKKGEDNAARLAGALTGKHPPRDPREAARAAGRGDVPDRPGLAYGPQRFAPELEELTRRIGINRHARAMVGEAYTTQRVNAGPGATPGTHVHFTGSHQAADMMTRWPYHYAAVVAESLDRHDQITLENITRSGTGEQLDQELTAWMRDNFPDEMAKHAREAQQLLLAEYPITDPDPAMVRLQENRRRGGLVPQLIGRMLASYQGYERLTVQEAHARYKRMRDDTNLEPSRMWYFRMVSPGTDEAFYEHETGEANPMTMVAAFVPPPGRVTVDLAPGAEAPTAGNDRRALRTFAAQVNALVERGFTPEVQVVASVADSGVRARFLGHTRKNNVVDLLASRIDKNLVKSRSEVGTGHDRVTVSLSLT
ncbi:uncharacterized protein DUF4157 [Saccharothrix carnea]|uniref:Uncharacterized protein DUF4157 n=1 Tax=Saccharothrix carnea TaxID=1280637 RepID=A0A2P8HBU3_SACCR|nr:DUF4157 domain-containing protein [Saccharothrix carnea]PSL43682.1 uncharacterized protein DUF4157 [Saccharothrix carnea]